MNVAFITPGLPPKRGGPGLSSRLIVKALRERGIDVDLYLPAEGIQAPPSEGNTYYFPCRLYETLIGKNVGIVKHLRRKLQKYDLIHVYSPELLPGAILARTKKTVPIVATINGFIWACLHPMRKLKEGCTKCSTFRTLRCALSRSYFINKMLVPNWLGAMPRWFIGVAGKGVVKKADIFIALTESIKDILIQSGFREEKIKIVPNILDPSFSNRGKKEKRIIFVGRLAREKGISNLVIAYSKLPSKLRQQWELNIYGRGREEPYVQKLIKRLDIDNIKVGYLENSMLPQVYRQAGLLVHPALWPEPFSRTWLEAMASGTPILSSANPSAKEVLKGCALFFDPFDVEDLRDKLEYMLRHKDIRELLGKNGLRKSHAYRPEKVAFEIEQVYRLVL